MTSPKLQSIARKRIRNLVRGIIASSDHANTFEVMNNLRKEANPTEMQIATEIMLTSPTGLRLFNPDLSAKTIEEVLQRPFYHSASIDVEIANQITKLKLNQETAVAALHDLARIDRSFFAGDASKFSQYMHEHVEKFGLSLTVMRRAISSRYTRLSGIEGYDISSILTKFLGGRRYIVAAALDESCDWERSYAEVRRKYTNLISIGRVKGSSAALIQDLFSLEKGQISDALQAHGRWSALDIAEYLNWLKKTQRLSEDISAQILLPTPIQSALEAFKGRNLSALMDMVSDDPDLRDYTSLRHLAAWRQYDDIAEYKSALESRLSDRLSGIFPARRWPKEHRPSTTMTLEEVVDAWSVRKYDSPTGMLARTVEVLPFLIEPRSDTSPTGELLLHILNNTVDISLLTSPEEIKTCWKPSATDRLYNYLRCAILSEADGGGLSKHAYRRALQTLVATDFDGSILDLFKHLDVDHKHVSEHLFSQCSESFLTELYHIFPASEDVINAQIELYEHYGETRKDSSATDIAKAQQLNLRLRRVRGALDDTRLYVDPLKFIQWGLEYLAPSLREFAAVKHLLDTSTPPPVTASTDISTSEDNRARLSSLLNIAFREFCENKFYGIESYIGRRIRHGTLTGMLVDEMRYEVEECIGDCTHRAPGFANFLRIWFTALNSKVQTLGERSLYVRSKTKPDGIIVSAAEGSEKRNILQSMERRVLAALEPNQPVSQAVAVIYEYCWQLVQVDLLRARQLIGSVAASSVIDSADHINGLNDSSSDLVMKCSRRLNTALAVRCDTLSSWLTRPSSASPSASLEQIFQVVLEEVFARRPGNAPQLELLGSTSLDVFGHRFHAIYDILYILVDNASRHGAPSGRLRFSARTIRSTSEVRTILMALESDLLPQEMLAARASIGLALGEPLDDALVTEGRSGIRKIRLIVQDYPEFNNFQVTFLDGSVQFSVEMSLHV